MKYKMKPFMPACIPTEMDYARVNEKLAMALCCYKVHNNLVYHIQLSPKTNPNVVVALFWLQPTNLVL